MNRIWDAIVFGGGQAGLATGHHLQKSKLQFLILESEERAAGSWPKYYDSLKLFSPAQFSSLPGMKIPGDPDRYPTKSEVISYLEDYQKYFNLPIVRNSKVISVVQENHEFTIQTASGSKYKSKSIINATGSFNNPFTPSIKGQELFMGRTIHSADYLTREAFTNQRVVVVGSRNSAVQIAIELADVSNTTLAVRHPVKIVSQKILGKDLHFWLRIIGFDTFPFWKFGKTVPTSNSVIDSGNFKELLDKGKPDQKQMFTSFYSEGVVWPDGTKEPVDTVIFATGYQSNFPYLLEVEALDVEGNPIHAGGVSTSTPGLYYVGIEGQQSFASATLRGVDSDAGYVVRKLLDYLEAIK
ncbi:flavin-containing monooxygenase [Cytobacillus praedii]|uniref:flavin-containing monooxygenase n=1 Tax=Cytobacillus praedii TaxID=1742358 RepID=UPI003AF7D76D